MKTQFKSMSIRRKPLPFTPSIVKSSQVLLQSTYSLPILPLQSFSLHFRLFSANQPHHQQIQVRNTKFDLDDRPYSLKTAENGSPVLNFTPISLIKKRAKDLGLKSRYLGKESWGHIPRRRTRCRRCSWGLGVSNRCPRCRYNLGH